MPSNTAFDLIQRLTDDLSRRGSWMSDEEWQRSGLEALESEARAYLAQPIPAVPSDEELHEFLDQNDWNHISPETFCDIARSVLDRWAQ
jgi:hypothetical protein